MISQIEAEKRKLSPMQKCQQEQQRMITSHQVEFMKSRLHKPINVGNMFDEKHQEGAKAIHELEKSVYAAKFKKAHLVRTHKHYMAAIDSLVGNLKTGTPMEQKTVAGLLNELKKKAQATRHSLGIADRKQSQLEEQQLRDATQIGKDLESLDKSTAHWKRPRETDEVAAFDLPISHKKKRSDSKKHPTWVRQTVNLILSGKKPPL